MTVWSYIAKRLCIKATSSVDSTVISLLYLRTAFYADFFTVYNTELFSSQWNTTLYTCETISVKELLVISYKLDTSFYQLHTGCTPLGIVIAVAILANIVTLVFGEGLSSKRLWTHCADKAFWVVDVTIMLYWWRLNGLITPGASLVKQIIDELIVC